MGTFKETDWKPKAPHIAGDLRWFLRRFPDWTVQVVITIDSGGERVVKTSKTAVLRALRGVSKYSWVRTRLNYETNTITVL